MEGRADKDEDETKVSRQEEVSSPRIRVLVGSSVTIQARKAATDEWKKADEAGEVNRKKSSSPSLPPLPRGDRIALTLLASIDTSPSASLALLVPTLRLQAQPLSLLGLELLGRQRGRRRSSFSVRLLLLRMRDRRVRRQPRWGRRQPRRRRERHPSPMMGGREDGRRGGIGHRGEGQVVVGWRTSARPLARARPRSPERVFRCLVDWPYPDTQRTSPCPEHKCH